VFSAIFLKSTFSLVQVVGIVLLLGAIIAVQYQRRSGKVDTALLYIVLSAITFAAAQVTSAAISTQLNGTMFMLFTYAGMIIAPLVVMPKTIIKDCKLLQHHNIKLTSEAIGFVAIASFLYYAFTYFAYRSAPDRGIVVILLTTQVVLSVLLGVIFLKERKNIKRKLLASTMAVIAGIMIKS
jgi:drug/metabolite transporter (DMT)-like permease